MATDVTLRAVLTGSSAGAVQAFNETSLAADASGSKATASMDAATGKIGGMFQKLGTTMGNMGLPFSNSVSKIGGGFKDIDGNATSTISKISSLGKAILGIGTVAAVAIAGESIKAFDSFDQANQQYINAAKNAGESTKAAGAELSTASGKMQGLGFNATDTASALTIAARAGDTGSKANNVLAVSADYARAKGISLASATQLVTQAQQGNQKSLKQLGINQDLGSAKAKTLASDQQSLANANRTLDETQQKINDGSLKGVAAQQALANAQASVSEKQQKLTLDQQSGGAVLDAIKQKTQGAAAAYGKTLAGQMDVAKATVDNLAIKLGGVLVPMLTKTISVVTGVVTWFTKHKTIAEALAAVIGGALAFAVGVYITLTGIKMVKATQDAAKGITSLLQKIGLVPAAADEAGAAETEFGETSEAVGEESSLAFGPIGIAIMAVVAIGLLLVTHWKQVKEFLSTTWNAIKDAAIAVWGFIRDHLKDIIEAIIIAITGPIGLLAIFLYDHWTTIKNDVVNLISAVVGFFTALPGKILNTLSGIVTTIWAAFNGAASWVNNNVITPVVSFFTGLPQDILSTLSGIVTTIWGAFTGAAAWVNTNVILPVVTYFTGLPAQLAGALSNIVGTVFGGLAGAWTWLYNNAYMPIVNGFKNLPTDIANGVMGALSGLSGLAKAILNPIISGINDAINHINSVTGSIPVIGGSLHIPDIPPLATGGPLRAGQLALVGEKGPELFRPSTSGDVIPNDKIGGFGGDSRTENNITVHANTNANAHDIANEVGWALRVA